MPRKSKKVKMEQDKETRCRSDECPDLENKEQDGNIKTDKGNDYPLPIEKIASGSREQKLVFDGYSDRELERLWVCEYDEKSQLKWVDFKKLESVRQQQIELLGSEQMYKRVNINLKNMRFEPHFAQEQSKLFHWRMKFFREHFPLRDYDGEAEARWTCNVNITQHWPKVATFAFCFPPAQRNCFGALKVLRPSFDSSEEDTIMASYLYEREYVGGNVLENGNLSLRALKACDLTMKDVFHKFVSDYATEPLKLKDLALKNVMAYELPLDELPKEVQEPVEKGLFTKISDIEKMLSEEGKRRLAGIRETVEQCRGEEDLNDFKDLDDYYQFKKGNTN